MDGSTGSLLLQWGRGLSPTETRVAQDMRQWLRVLQWGRGLSPTETPSAQRSVAVVSRASMGPRAFAHGDAFVPRFPENRVDELQWGRGLSPTETSSRIAMAIKALQLQWGRGLSPTETFWKRVSVNLQNGLQWGRGLSPTETVPFVAVLACQVVASMGPRAFAHGDKQSNL